MRVGILTLPLGNNYGGVLQNYALQEVLRSEGHQPITITHEYFFPWYVTIFNKIKVGMRLIKGGKGNYEPSSNNSFVEKFVSHTPSITFLNNSIVKKYKFDVVIVGSDQVWRPRYNPNNLPDFYLRFVKAKECKKFAYAASFGVDNCEYTPQQIKECAKYAHELRGISVREETGVFLCESYFGIKPKIVLDPTLLLSNRIYDGLCKQSKLENSNFLLAYVLDENQTLQTIIMKIANTLGLPIITIKANGKEPVEVWLSLFRDASFVVTDSFHGTVFSIIFETEFIAYPNSKRGASRFDSLLSNLGLNNRLIKEQFNPNLLSENINWENVNMKLNILKKSSMEFIREMMS